MWKGYEMKVRLYKKEPMSEWTKKQFTGQNVEAMKKLDAEITGWNAAIDYIAKFTDLNPGVDFEVIQLPIGEK
jgi:hypothetical protein